jgi:hypothetical protein
MATLRRWATLRRCLPLVDTRKTGSFAGKPPSEVFTFGHLQGFLRSWAGVATALALCDHALAWF